MAINTKAAIKYELYCRAKKYRTDNKDAQWDQVAEYLWGDQNIRRATDEDQNDFVVNICYKQFHILQSMLCRDIPSVTMRTITGDEEMDPVRDTAQRLLVQNWRANDIQVRLTELTSYGIPFNNAFFKITWDETMRLGVGDMRIEVPDTRNIFFLPGIGSVRKSLIMYERKYVDKLTALHMFPEQKDAIDAAFKLQPPHSSAGAFVGGGVAQYANVAGNSTYSWADSNSGRADERPMIEIVEEWSIDPTTLKMVPELFERVAKTPKYKALDYEKQDAVGNMKLYPRGRLCVFSGEHEFESAPNPFPSFPYVQYVGQTIPATRPGDELGMGDLDQELEIQDMLNTRQNQITDALDHTAMGGFGLAGLGVVDPDEFNSKPRRIYMKRMPQGEFDWFNPPTVPAEAFKSVSDIRGMADDVMNIHGIVSSGDTKDIRSGQGIEELSELANRVLVTRTYSLEACFRSLVRYQLYMMGSPYYRRGVHYPDSVNLEGLSPDAFEIFITAGLNLPLSKQSSMAWLRTLRELDAIDNEALLDNTDISILPDRDTIKARMREKEMAAQQMANAQGQAQVDNTNAQTEETRANAQVIPMGAY